MDHSTFISCQQRLTVAYKSYTSSNQQRWTLPWTEFHSAILRSDFNFVTAILQCHPDPEFARFLCNSQIDTDAETGNHGNIIAFEENTTDRSVMRNFLESSPIGKFSFRDMVEKYSTYKTIAGTLPLTFACFTGSIDMVCLLLDNGASIHATDAYRANIVHNVVFISTFDANFTLAVYWEILNRVQNVNERYKLLTAENILGLNPLDGALKLSRLEFIKVQCCYNFTGLILI